MSQNYFICSHNMFLPEQKYLTWNIPTCKPYTKSKTEEHKLKLFPRKRFQPFKIKHHVSSYAVRVTFRAVLPWLHEIKPAFHLKCCTENDVIHLVNHLTSAGEHEIGALVNPSPLNCSSMGRCAFQLLENSKIHSYYLMQQCNLLDLQTKACKEFDM